MMKKSLLLVVVVAQSLALIIMIGRKQYTLNTGTEVILETLPIDPRSLFRGDYVILNYAINTLRSPDLPGVAGFRVNETIYVRLRQGEPFWQPVSVHREMPSPAAGEVVVRGRVVFANPGAVDPESGQREPYQELYVRYGIESYFVPEGEGRELEQPRQDAELSMRVAVDRFGNAGIKAVLINGQERYVERLF